MRCSEVNIALVVESMERTDQKTKTAPPQPTVLDLVMSIAGPAFRISISPRLASMFRGKFVHQHPDSDMAQANRATMPESLGYHSSQA